VFALGYVWVDLFVPQRMGFSFMQTIPVALIIGATAFVSVAFTQKHDNPRMGAGIWLLILFAIWITLTTLWAEIPNEAWVDWDTAFKTVAFAAFLPFLIRTRTHVEALLLVLGFSILGNTLAGAVKVLVSGGHYGQDLGLFRGNSGIVEGSTLATVAVSFIPVLLYLRKHSQFFPKGFLNNGLFYTAAGANVICALGTFTRSGLIAIAVLLFLMLWNSKRKVLTAVLMAGAVFATANYFVSDAYKDRMNTVVNYQGDGSAMLRLGVWQWTVDYALTHPWGGGFEVWRTNSGTITLGRDDTIQSITSNPNERNFAARAFHSIYFEILGEHGFPGLALFAGIVFTFLSCLRRMQRLARGNPELEWASDLAKSLRTCLIIYLCGGAFIGVAFQPYFYHLFAGVIAINEYLFRVTAPQQRKSLTQSPAFGAT
jgi:probable O-glycosylation ligase (exosortase A-associated)